MKFSRFSEYQGSDHLLIATLGWVNFPRKSWVSFKCKSITPLQEWNRDTRPLTFIDVNTVSEAFLYHEERKVDKGACIRFKGQRYETKASLIGRKVEISYDPMSPETLIIRHPGIEPFEVKPLKIGEYCDQKPTLPVEMQLVQAKSSRLLDGLQNRHEESRKLVANAISFADYGKEDECDV